MSQELLKKFLQDSENYKSKIVKGVKPEDQGGKTKILQQSKKIQKAEKPSARDKRVIGDKFKSIVKKMKVSTDKNLILEKNVKYLKTIKAKTKVSSKVASYLLEKLNQSS